MGMFNRIQGRTGSQVHIDDLESQIHKLKQKQMEKQDWMTKKVANQLLFPIEAFNASQSGRLSQIKKIELICCDHTLLPLFSMLVINTYSVCLVHVDLRLWIWRSDPGPPSQISNHGNDVKTYVNGPIRRRGHTGSLPPSERQFHQSQKIEYSDVFHCHSG